MNIRWIGGACAALAIAGAFSAMTSPAEAATPAATTLIPRTAMFGNPVKAQARLSPDGKYLVTGHMLRSDGRIWEIDTGTFYRRLGKDVMR